MHKKLYVSASASNSKLIENIDEYHKLELAEIFVRVRALLSLRIQVWTFLSTANLTLFGIGVKENEPFIIFSSPLLMCLPPIVDIMLLRIIDVLLARGLQIEKFYPVNEEALQISLMLSYFPNKSWLTKISPKTKTRSDARRELKIAKTVDEIVNVIKYRPFNTIGNRLFRTVFLLEYILGLCIVR